MKTRVVLAWSFVLLPRVVMACPVCFGELEAPLAKATSLGIGFMLALTVLVLGGMAAFFASLARRAALVSRRSATSPAPPADGVAGGVAGC